ncbi:MAG: ATP-binding cassette domain-containing protein [Candidatus Limnocylindrales bacterium]
MAPLLQLEGVSRTFGNVVALRDVDMHIGAAEAVGLIGDNGAGKSTLVKILSGVHPPTAGTIRLDGEPVSFGSPLDARRSGIEMIYQDLALCDDLDVTANVFLGREPKRRLVGPLRVLDRERMRDETLRMLAELGLSIGPDRVVGALSGGERQMVAVARALQFQPRLLLMDEPTAALSAEKIRVLMGLVEGLKQRGVAILLISHRFTDILHVCDRIVVVRQGSVVGELQPHAQPPEHTMALMAELMTGDRVVSA